MKVNIPFTAKRFERVYKHHLGHLQQWASNNKQAWEALSSSPGDAAKYAEIHSLSLDQILIALSDKFLMKLAPALHRHPRQGPMFSDLENDCRFAVPVEI